LNTTFSITRIEKQSAKVDVKISHSALGKIVKIGHTNESKKKNNNAGMADFYNTMDR
jgi:hypothetical protein